MRPDLVFMDAIVPAAADEGLVMGEDAFRAFYDRTARQVWAYLYRKTGDGALSDDLLQEAYYRLLRARRSFESDAHRLHYLFRVAANLLADRRRHAVPEHVPLAEHHGEARPAENAVAVERRADLDRAMATLAPRDRDMLWLAYADGASHQEIADHLGVGRPSIKAMLFRARQRLAARLRATGAALHGRGRTSR
jgi:RNA polymerase sigma-70 factor (ECF subfamily)